jgi:hypothetical protein
MPVKPNRFWLQENANQSNKLLGCYVMVEHMGFALHAEWDLYLEDDVTLGLELTRILGRRFIQAFTELAVVRSLLLLCCLPSIPGRLPPPLLRLLLLLLLLP